jgi:hypothetical protein
MLLILQFLKNNITIWYFLHHLNSSTLALHDHFLIGIVVGGVQVVPLGTVATSRPVVPAPGDYDDGEIGGIIGIGNQNTRTQPAPLPLCPSQTPHAARTRIRAAAVGSPLLTTWATVLQTDH